MSACAVYISAFLSEYLFLDENAIASCIEWCGHISCLLFESIFSVQGNQRNIGVWVRVRFYRYGHRTRTHPTQPDTSTTMCQWYLYLINNRFDHKPKLAQHAYPSSMHCRVARSSKYRLKIAVAPTVSPLFNFILFVFPIQSIFCVQMSHDSNSPLPRSASERRFFPFFHSAVTV